MEITLRKATESDFDSILSLIKELAVFEKAGEKVTNTLAQMRSEKEHFECFVAETETHGIVGIALYFFAYYTWVGKSLYLDDLYVRTAFRRKKIATRLLQKIFEVAREKQCKRVRWQVLNWNTKAIDFYKKCGVKLDGEWINCDTSLPLG